MCKHPVTINVKNKDFQPIRARHLKYIPLRTCNGPLAIIDESKQDIRTMYSRRVITVPCGKCSECLKARQNDLSVRAMREAAKRGSMVFLTLTYNNDTLPLSCCLEQVDTDTGEVVSTSCASPLFRYQNYEETVESRSFIDFCRAGLEKLSVSPFSRRLYVDIATFDGVLYRYCITPSLNRRDVRLWLKAGRVAYKREFGVSMPDFSYLVCGEYGPKTCRPHYHICFFGLPYKDCLWLAHRWEYGFFNIKPVSAVNSDGTSGFQIAGNYIGKYMSKGKFECDSVKCKLSEKPRLMISRRLGNELDNNLIAYYRAYDVFGHYDINSLLLSDGRKLTDEQLRRLFAEVTKRSKFVFGERSFCLPRSMVKYLWYYYDEDFKAYRASVFRALHSDFVQSQHLASDRAKLEQNRALFKDGFFEDSVSEFSSGIVSDYGFEEELEFDSIRRFYLSSIF